MQEPLAYLLPKLKAEGLRVAQVDGSVNSEERLRIRKRFELERTETEALDMLLFTEVGSEGLDYQFCDTIVNYDLPWNPMRIEQRIGRIDRRGQKSSVVHIYNTGGSGRWCTAGRPASWCSRRSAGSGCRFPLPVLS